MMHDIIFDPRFKLRIFNPTIIYSNSIVFIYYTKSTIILKIIIYKCMYILGNLGEKSWLLFNKGFWIFEFSSA